MYLSLDQQFKKAMKLIDKGKIKVVSVSEVGDRITIVLMPENSKKVIVVDNSHLPPSEHPDQTMEQVLATRQEEAEKKKKEIEEEKKAKEIEKASCQYCGRQLTKRGLTRHENKCVHNPDNQPSMKPRRRKK